MVSPAVIRKTNKDKVKKIVSKVNRHDVKTRNNNESGVKVAKAHHGHNTKKVSQMHGKEVAPAMYDSTNLYSSKFASGNHVLSSSQTSGKENERFYHEKNSDYLSTNRQQYGENLSAYAGRDLQNVSISFRRRYQEMQDIRDCLFPAAAVTTRNANGSSIHTRPWNEPNMKAPMVSDVGIGASTSTMPLNKSDDTYTHDSLNTGDGIIDSSKPKRKRGKTKGYNLKKNSNEGQRFEVMFPAHVNRPVGSYSTMFTTEIGVLVRQIAPLQAKSWKYVCREKKDQIIARLRDKFIFSNTTRVNESVESAMAKRYSSWRTRIHEEFLKYESVAAAVSNPPPFKINLPDWLYLCNLFTTDEYKAISDRNRKNREKLRSAHTAGTKAFSKIRYDKRDKATGSDLDFVDLYKDTHTNSDGIWVHENAQNFHESLKEKKCKAKTDGTSLTDEELSVLTFGRKPGYICGLGRGPKPTSSATGKCTRAQLERESYEASKRAEVAEREIVEARREVVEARKETAILAEKMKSLESQQTDFSERLREEMSSKFAFIQQLFESSMREKTSSNGMEKGDFSFTFGAGLL